MAAIKTSNGAENETGKRREMSPISRVRSRAFWSTTRCAVGYCSLNSEASWLNQGKIAFGDMNFRAGAFDEWKLRIGKNPDFRDSASDYHFLLQYSERSIAFQFTGWSCDLDHTVGGTFWHLRRERGIRDYFEARRFSVK